MLKYIIKRILTMIPMLIGISLLAFIISINAPVDPIEKLARSSESEGEAGTSSVATKQIKQEWRRKLGLDLPIFYFSITDLASCDTLYKVHDKDHQKNLKKLTHESGNWQSVSNYYKNLLQIQKTYETIDIKALAQEDSLLDLNPINETKNQFGIEVGQLLSTSDNKIIEISFNKMNKLVLENNFLYILKEPLEKSITSREELKSNTTVWKTYIPSVNWYGVKNQYHTWLFGNGKNRKGLFRGDFGFSYIDKQKVETKIWDKIGISFTFSLISIFIAYLVSIPIGIFSAYKKDSKSDRSISFLLFILYAMPSFFIGLLLLFAFANPDNLSWFPVSGIQDPSTWNPDWAWYEMEAIKHRLPYLILPLITYTYGSFAFLSRIMRIGMIDVINQDYIRTARAKGLSERKVILKHALRNSLLPIITVFAAIFPMAIGGSIIIEVIFSIPGMGVEILNSLTGGDYPMIITIFTISGFLTMVGYLVSDILYAVVDPRISYK